jgi:Fe-Mn family superoxide dismutase
MVYKVQEHLKPQGLDNISNQQIESHWELYKGYVAQVNKLNEELIDLRGSGKIDTPLCADRRRRYGFEYNGMVLHEYYFANLTAKGIALTEGPLKKALLEQWGSYELWHKDFEAAGKSRSIGWAILYADETTGALTNHFIQEHENGTIAGFAPILVLDVWEHAYMVDYGSLGRAQYIAAFMKNINWKKAEERYNAVIAKKLISRF